MLVICQPPAASVDRWAQQRRAGLARQRRDSRTIEPGSDVPKNVGVVSLVIRSVLEMPVSLAASSWPVRLTGDVGHRHRAGGGDRGGRRGR
jgi:hypothetical protein